ncbi:MAG: hypothetical protein KAR19_19020 [Bacteroidales bacterium]|nr:hypothetical protein [Bacteroidales bacterium]
MAQQQIENGELDRLIHNVLTSNDDLMIPHGLSEKTILKLEKKVLLRELILELSFKVGLVLGSLSLLAGVFVWINGSGVLTSSYTYFVNNWQEITSLLFLALIIILIDQIGLRFYNAINKVKSHHRQNPVSNRL